MKKKDALAYIKSEKGFIPYVGIFEIYGDDDDVPKELINYTMKNEKAPASFLICSAEVAEQLKKVFNLESNGNNQ
jgi:hypothetical protein